MKKHLPSPIRARLGRLRVVYKRLRVWSRVARKLGGKSKRDSEILRRAILKSPFTVWSDADKWQFPMVSQDCVVLARGVGVFRIRGQTDDLFHALPGQEPAVEDILRNTLRSGDTFIDAGSNIGFYAVLASRLVGPVGHVIACEMVPETARILRDHISINGCKNIVVEEGALAPISGRMVEASVSSGRSGTASIEHNLLGQVIRVPTIALAEILKSVERVRLMKMDLEGAELGALKGLGEELVKVESIVFENKNDPETVKFLEINGFSIRRIDGSNAVAARDTAQSA